MPAPQARELASEVAGGRDDVVRIPTDTTIVIEDDNRILPKLPPPDLAHYMSRERLA